ncbi:MAG TPA: DUF1844 domain-containing protein [Candidatus Eisenbacteria bacterium]|nr:DUF1844 domain-containing protein [Candidatus Eisenbacteria bacterium]
MSSSNLNDDVPASASREEIKSALFANMVMQQTNMTLMFLGKVPHPQTHEMVKDLEAAQMFIEQLEMLESKTKGNLNKQEESLLKQSLMSLRLAFVEEIEKGEQPQKPPASQGQSAGEAPAALSQTDSALTADESESRKKFSKKY